MTYTIKTTRVQTPANGVATTFPFGFRILAASDLYVALVDSDGGETAQVLDSDYTVSTGPWVSGGSIVFGTAPADTYDVLIERRTPLEQTEAFLAGGSFNAARVMGVLDKLVMMIQEARRETSDLDTLFANLTLDDFVGLVAALAAKAPLDSPALTGTPTAPTAATATNTTQVATTAFVQAVVAALINSAPGALDTLDELAAAMGDDPNFAATVTNALAGKLAKASNLSDLTDAVAARTNLGLGALALQDTAAQADVDGLVAALAAFTNRFLDRGGAVTTGGSANAYTATTSEGWTALAAGKSLTLRAHEANTGAVTLDVDGLGPKPWLTNAGTALPSGHLQAGQYYRAIYDAVTDTFKGASYGDQIIVYGAGNTIHLENYEDPTPVALGTAPQFASRAAFATWVAGGGTAADGVVVSDGTVQYVASSGATAISDLGGWLPFGDVAPQHWGAVADGSSDCYAAIQAAIDYVSGFASGTAKRVLIYKGNYYVTDTITVSEDDIEIIGAGVNSTYIERDTDYGDTFLISAADPSTRRLARVGVSNLQIWMRAEMTNGAHLAIKGIFQGAFNNLSLWDGYAGVDIEGAQNTIFDNLIVKSGTYYTVSTVAGSAFVHIKDANHPSHETGELFFSNFNLVKSGSLTSPIENGLYIQQADGVWFTNGHVMGAETECRIEPQSSTKQVQGLLFQNVLFDQFCTRNILITGTSTTGFSDIHFKDCDMAGGSTNVVEVNSTATNLTGLTFVGGTYHNSGGSEVFKIDAGFHIRIASALILSRTAPASGAKCVRVGSAPRYVNIVSNEIGTTAGTFDSGVEIVTASNILNITGNHFHGCTNEIELSAALRNHSKIDGNSSTSSATSFYQVVGASTLTINSIADSIDVITTSANVQNINYGWEGRRIILRSAGVNTTYEHGTGSGGSLIYTNTGANLTVPSGRCAIATYHQAGGFWWVVL